MSTPPSWESGCQVEAKAGTWEHLPLTREGPNVAIHLSKLLPCERCLGGHHHTDICTCILSYSLGWLLKRNYWACCQYVRCPTVPLKGSVNLVPAPKVWGTVLRKKKKVPWLLMNISSRKWKQLSLKWLKYWNPRTLQIFLSLLTSEGWWPSVPIFLKCCPSRQDEGWNSSKGSRDAAWGRGLASLEGQRP